MPRNNNFTFANAISIVSCEIPLFNANFLYEDNQVLKSSLAAKTEIDLNIKKLTKNKKVVIL